MSPWPPLLMQVRLGELRLDFPLCPRLILNPYPLASCPVSLGQRRCGATAFECGVK